MRLVWPGASICYPRCGTPLLPRVRPWCDRECEKAK
ncbi:unnamed protein product [Linum tenue]|uniref:DUF2256 domain-containing protein n=1 Tax=Linum tenue TaxID=586396 RepID=A0AAV0MM58_9ROSI|nr:unnamed protein product [Linum tenue]